MNAPRCPTTGKMIHSMSSLPRAAAENRACSYAQTTKRDRLVASASLQIQRFLAGLLRETKRSNSARVTRSS